MLSSALTPAQVHQVISEFRRDMNARAYGYDKGIARIHRALGVPNVVEPAMPSPLDKAQPNEQVNSHGGKYYVKRNGKPVEVQDEPRFHQPGK